MGMVSRLVPVRVALKSGEKRKGTGRGVAEFRGSAKERGGSIKKRMMTMVMEEGHEVEVAAVVEPLF